MPKIFKTEITESEAIALQAFEEKFNEKIITVRMTCECGEDLYYDFPTLAEVMLAFATHSC
jgi:hypothetical protein